MDLIAALNVYSEVARRRSFSRAAEHLRMTNSNVTKHVAWLERHLGAQLLMRTTKSVSVTQAGLKALEMCTDITEMVGVLRESVRQNVGVAEGVLRIGVRASFTLFQQPDLLHEFCAHHPDLQVVIHLDDGRADIVAEGWDLSLRIAHHLEDTSLVATRIATVRRVLVASDSYLKEHGIPDSVQQLVQHNCLVTSADTWHFESKSGPSAVAVSGSLRTNLLEILRSATQSGLGIAIFPHFLVEEDLRLGRLRELLPYHRPAPLKLFAIFPAHRHMPQRVRTFVDFLREQLPPITA